MSIPAVRPSALHTHDSDDAWGLLLFLAARARAGHPVTSSCGFVRQGTRWVDAQGAVHHEQALHVRVDSGQVTLGSAGHSFSAEGEALLALLVPLVTGPGTARLVVGHLGQSLDGRVATPT